MRTSCFGLQVLPLLATQQWLYQLYVTSSNNNKTTIAPPLKCIPLQHMSAISRPTPYLSSPSPATTSLDYKPFTEHLIPPPLDFNCSFDFCHHHFHPPSARYQKYLSRILFIPHDCLVSSAMTAPPPKFHIATARIVPPFPHL